MRYDSSCVPCMLVRMQHPAEMRSSSVFWRGVRGEDTCSTVSRGREYTILEKVSRKSKCNR